MAVDTGLRDALPVGIGLGVVDADAGFEAPVVVAVPDRPVVGADAAVDRVPCEEVQPVASSSARRHAARRVLTAASLMRS
jgi:hypothetical protein